MYATLKSVGSYVPKKILSNSYFENIIDTSDEWIRQRTGIHERRIAEDEECSDLGYKASLVAIKRANIEIKEIDLIICATISGDYISMPSTACIIAKKLGLDDVAAFDISAACSGYIYMLNIAKSFIESKTYKNILIVGSEKISKIIDYTDRSTCILFGDGAGASIIGSSENKEDSIVDVHISSNGNYYDFLYTDFEEKKHLHMKGNETFKMAIKTLTNDAQTILSKNGLSGSDIDLFVPHQANYRIIKSVQKILGLEDEKIFLNLSKYGNTSAASIPIALSEAYESSRLKKGDLLLLDAFGGGITWGSALINFYGS